MTLSMDATYSAEDNKLRLYASERLDSELYQHVKAAGFKCAPKQDLFVAPKWTPDREDLCIELAGEITAEGTTVVERAQAKAERLDSLAKKRAGQAGHFHAAAQRISERFVAGQPILVGHHSERRARKDKAHMDAAMQKAVAAQEAVHYWHHRAEGVERHANHKAAPGVRARRIKALLADLRDHQRRVNHAHKCLELWTTIDAMGASEKQDKAALYYAGAQLAGGGAAPYTCGDSLWHQLDRAQITTRKAIDSCLAHWEYVCESPYHGRWISHILNRLAFERGELGEVARFEGELTPVILQAFAREHGAEKPKAAKEGDGFHLVSDVPLPLHLADGKILQLDAESWRDLMQSVGYSVVIKARKPVKRQACPLINPTPDAAAKLQALWNADAAHTKYGKPSERIECEQAHYSAHSKGAYGRYRTVSLDAWGREIWPSSRVGEKPTPVVRVRVGSGSGLYSADRVMTITDKPTKPLPLDLDTLLSEPAGEGPSHG